MKTVNDSKNEILTTLAHIRRVIYRVRQHSGAHQSFTFPDAHKLSEGLLLSIWTHWEEFIQELLIIDLATDPNGFLRHDIRRFRTNGAPIRYSEKILNHPDSPDRWVEWNYSEVYSRANLFLNPGHRFPQQLVRHDDLYKLKRIRNGIAHKSDKAWGSFLELVRTPPFGLNNNQRKGLTVGRFIFSHHWNVPFVLEESINLIELWCNQLVP